MGEFYLNFSEVYRAIEKSTKQLVAIKKMSLERSQEGFPIAALREIGLLSNINHKNIVNFLEMTYAKYSPPEFSFHHPVRPKFNYLFNFFMISEYMEHSLSGLINRGIAFNNSQVKYIIYEALEGLEFLHSLKIMHRDIKSYTI